MKMLVTLIVLLFTANSSLADYRLWMKTENDTKRYAKEVWIRDTVVYSNFTDANKIAERMNQSDWGKLGKAIVLSIDEEPEGLIGDHYGNLKQSNKKEVIKLKSDPDILTRKVFNIQPPIPITTDSNDMMAVLRRIDSRLANVETQLPNYSAQLTSHESRISVLERASGVVPLRAVSTLTDPVAAAAAGRVVGTYDQFGRLLAPPTVSVSPSFGAVLQTSGVLPSASFFASSSTVSAGYGVGSGGCSGGSCGRRNGLIRRIFGRR